MAGIASNAQNRRAHFTYIWKTEHIPMCASQRSPVFSVDSMQMTKWSLHMLIYLNSSACLWIEREEENYGPESIEVEFEISILNTSGTSIVKKSGTDHFRKKVLSKGFLFDEITAMFDRRGEWFSPKGPLTVRCCLWRIRTEISTFEMCFARTRFDVYHPSCVWAIKGFSSLQEREKRIRILNPTTKGCPKLILSLSITEENGKECFLFHLETPQSNNCCLCFQVDAEIALLDAEGIVCHLAEELKFINKKITTLYSIEKTRLLEVSLRKDILLSDDVLLLRCELKLTPFDPVWSGIEDYKLMGYADSELVQEKNETHLDELNETAVCPFKDIVKKFKEDGALSDVSLRSGTKSFPVHKLILSSRSPVFRAMFTKDMKEKTSKCIDIPDLDAETLGRLLLYIYEDKIQDLTWVDAANLFEAADKYELLDLKEKCSIFLKSNFLKSNVCKILVIADMHHDESLRKSAQDFIRNNPEIVSSDIWKVFRNNHSELAWETAEQVICNIKHSKS